MKTFFDDPALNDIDTKLHNGDRLDETDGLLLYRSHDLVGIGRLADRVRRQRHGRNAYFVYNQHLNYTNVCRNRCRFCAFARDRGEKGAYTFSNEDVTRWLTSRMDQPIREIHIVGGLNPSLPFDYYLTMLQTIQSIRPRAVIKAFTAVEIDFLSEISGLSLDETIIKLKNAGLSMVPGGGAEVMSERVRLELFPRKISGDRWLDIMATLHRHGITSNATMLYGHIETIEERVSHLVRLREQQDKTGGFTAFIPLAFHSQNTDLAHLPPTTAVDDLKTVAIARLMLDNIDHIKAYWVMIGEKLAQVALSFGADDLDGTIMEERITHMAGATSAKGLTRKALEHMIRSAGFKPVERDSFYNPIREAA